MTVETSNLMIFLLLKCSLEDLVKMNNGSDFKWATDPEERNHLWKARHEILYACMALRPGSKVYMIIIILLVCTVAF
jgi:FAD/FMN-containing dehydrogenase